MHFLLKKKMMRRIKSSEGIPLIEINISSLVIFVPAKNLDIKQYTVNLVGSTIQEIFKDTKIMQKEEIITPSLPYKTTMLNVTNTITMVMKLVNVYCQNITKG
jgi:hypothetical protein